MAIARGTMNFAYSRGLAYPPIAHAPVTLAQTFIAGAVLVDASGKLSEAGADPTGVKGLAQISAANWLMLVNDVAPYNVASVGCIFEASVDKSGALGTGAIAATDLEKAYGIAKDSDGKWYIDLDETVETRIVIREFKDPVLTVMGRVYFEFLPVALE